MQTAKNTNSSGYSVHASYTAKYALKAVYAVKVIALGLMMGSLAYAQSQSTPTVPGSVAGPVPTARKIQMIQSSLMDTLNVMKANYAALYAPKDWKYSHLGWDLGQQYQNAVTAASMVTSVREARDVIMKFIYSMKDYHVSVSFVSTESAVLPFTVKRAGNRFFITFIDRSKLPTSSFPFVEGDEILNFGGRPILDVANDLMAETPANILETDQALTDISITRRRASRGLRVPTGSVLVEFKSKANGMTSKMQMHWDYTPEKINPMAGSDKSLASGSKSISERIAGLQMVGTNLEGAEKGSANNFMMGTKYSYIPALGEKTWTIDEDNEFDAYIANTADGKRVGVLRIPSYSPSTAGMGNAGYAGAIRDMAVILKKFEADTDMMVIDQINNPGGSVFYLYTIVSMMANRQAMQTPLHRMSINPEEIMDAYKTLGELESVIDDASAKRVLGETFAGYPVNYQVAMFYKNYARFLIQEWNAGKVMTDPFYIAGVDYINPSQDVDYTKPILIVVNELCFSGGDFFPAIMQDNGRAKVLGVRTAGAGGYVLSQKIPNLLGVDTFSITGSLAERVNQNPIENLGVTPEVGYALTADDFQNGFQGYKNAILSTVSTMLAP